MLDLMVWCGVIRELLRCCVVDYKPGFHIIVAIARIVAFRSLGIAEIAAIEVAMNLSDRYDRQRVFPYDR